jgi:hypothetical protein
MTGTLFDGHTPSSGQHMHEYGVLVESQLTDKGKKTYVEGHRCSATLSTKSISIRGSR